MDLPAGKPFCIPAANHLKPLQFCRSMIPTSSFENIFYDKNIFTNHLAQYQLGSAPCGPDKDKLLQKGNLVLVFDQCFGQLLINLHLIASLLK